MYIYSEEILYSKYWNTHLLYYWTTRLLLDEMSSFIALNLQSLVGVIRVRKSRELDSIAIIFYFLLGIIPKVRFTRMKKRNIHVLRYHIYGCFFSLSTIEAFVFLTKLLYLYIPQQEEIYVLVPKHTDNSLIRLRFVGCNTYNPLHLISLDSFNSNLLVDHFVISLTFLFSSITKNLFSNYSLNMVKMLNVI